MAARRWERAAEQYASGEHKSGKDLRLAVENVDDLRYSLDDPAAAPKGTERVLDIGAGAGHMALAFAPAVGSVVVTDPVEAMLDAARRVFREAGQSNATFQMASAEALPFEAGSFDIVTSRLAAHHFDNLELAWQEIARVLKPSGIFVLVDTEAPENLESARFLHDVETLRDPTHRHTLTGASWVRLCASHGFPQGVSTVVRKAHDFEPWLRRGGEEATTLARVRDLFTGAAAGPKAEFEIRMRDGVVTSFTDSKLVLAVHR